MVSGFPEELPEAEDEASRDLFRSSNLTSSSVWRALRPPPPLLLVSEEAAKERLLPVLEMLLFKLSVDLKQGFRDIFIKFT